MDNSALITRSEIEEWWEAERVQTLDALDEGRRAIFRDVQKQIENLTIGDLVSPRGSGPIRIRRHLIDRMNQLYREQVARLSLSAKTSLLRVEGEEGSWEMPLSDRSTVFAGGALAIGSLGTAAVATGAATSAGTFLLIVPTVAFSWPVFAGLGVAATAMAALAPSTIRRGAEKAKLGYANHVNKVLEEKILGQGNKEASMREILLAELDRLRTERCRALMS